MSPMPSRNALRVLGSALLGFALLACTHSAPTSEQSASLVTAPPVTHEDGSLSIDQFAACDVKPPQAPESGRSVQLFLHCEAPPGELEPDEFARVTEEVWRRSIAGLLVVPEAGTDVNSGALRCRPIDGPSGDVDYEVNAVVDREVASSVEILEVRSELPLVEVSGSGGGRCARDSMQNVYCAHSQHGVAVRTSYGGVACARGNCVMRGTNWFCSRAAGGWAEMTPQGPQCERGCYSPSVNQCRRVGQG